MTSVRVRENLRRVAARGTHQVLLRRGTQLDKWLGCGFPKSGTELGLAELAAARFEFRQAAGRASGQEDRTRFRRKGIAGDCANHFSAEAGEIFEAHRGAGLREWGYETTTDWYAQR